MLYTNTSYAGAGPLVNNSAAVVLTATIRTFADHLSVVQCLAVAHSSPNPRPRASVAARSAALAPVYLSTIARVDHPATAIRPPSDPPARSQRVAAVWRIRCNWKPSMPAALARAFRTALSP